MLDNLRFVAYSLDAESIFLFCAYAGTGVLIVQLFLSLLGLTWFEEIDSGEVDTGEHKSFKWLSIHAVSGFLMMAGWTGITAQKEFNLPIYETISIALVTGLFTFFISNFIYRAAKKLQSTGNVFKIHELIGKEGYVYQRIPRKGMGKVTLTHQDLTHEISAVSLNGEPIDSFIRVLIVNKCDDTTVVVQTLL